MITQKSVWVVENDNTTHDSLDKARQHLAGLEGFPYPCPACSTTGKTEDKNRPIYGEVPDDGYNGFFSRPQYGVIGYKSKPCPHCNGRGYTSKELRPVTKVVGWK